MHDSRTESRARQIIGLVAALISLSLVLILLDSRDMLDPVKGAAGDAISPVSGYFNDLGERISDDGPSDSELAQELAEVSAERDQLLAENAELTELVAEVQELREQLGFQESRPELETVTASVLARDPESLEKFLIIDRGSDDGLGVGMAVVSPNFLVGQIVEVDPNRARVRLVVDNTFQTGARLQNSRAAGILYGEWQSGGLAELRHIPLDTEIVQDELVVTSGRTSGIPEGLVIGRILELDRDSLGNEIAISVLPLVDYDSLNTVTVILGDRESGT